MLARLHKGATSFTVKVLLTLLLLTFALWGIGDTIRGHNRGVVLKIGDISYNQTEFHKIFQEQIASLQNQLGIKIGSHELNDPKLKEIILNQIINKSLLLQEAKNMGLLVSDDMVKYEISRIPLFIRDGKFNKELFDTFLRNSSLTENRFISMLKDDISTQNLSMAFNISRYVPQFMVENLTKSRTLNRDLKFVSIPYSLVKIEKTPTDDELKKIYESNGSKFTLPEKRDISYVSFGIKDIKSGTLVSDDILKEQYEGKKALFTIPEKRKVSQIIFNDKSKAYEASNLIKSGKSFLEVGTQYFPDKKNFELGEISKSGLQQEIADSIFKLNSGQTTEVLQSPLGYHIFLVSAIIPEKTKSFDDVKNELKQAYIQEKQFESLSEMAQAIDQMSLSGASLKEIAAKYNLTISTVKNLHEDSTTDREPVFLKTAFSMDEGHLSLVTPYKDNTMYFVLVANKVSPGTLKEFTTVKDELKQLWFKEMTTKKSQELAEKIYQSLVEQGSVDEIIKSYNLPKPNSITINYYSEQLSKLSPEIIKEAFRLEVGKFSKPIADSDGYIIIHLTKIDVASFEQIKEKMATTQMELMQSVSNEYYGEFMTNLRTKYKVEYDKSLVIGVDTDLQ